MGILGDRLNLETGTERRIEINCSKQTKTEFQKALNAMDPDLTFEEGLHVFLRAYDEQPSLFDRYLE